MPAYLVMLINMAIQFGGPILLKYLKKLLEKKYPEFAAAIEKLIHDLTDPDKSNSASRKQAKDCIGALCMPSVKES